MWYASKQKKLHKSHIINDLKKNKTENPSKDALGKTDKRLD